MSGRDNQTIFRAKLCGFEKILGEFLPCIGHSRWMWQTPILFFFNLYRPWLVTVLDSSLFLSTQPHLLQKDNRYKPQSKTSNGALLWNKLPEFIKSSTTKDIFKQRVHEICTRKRLFCLLLKFQVLFLPLVLNCNYYLYIIYLFDQILFCKQRYIFS